MDLARRVDAVFGGLTCVDEIEADRGPRFRDGREHTRAWQRSAMESLRHRAESLLEMPLYVTRELLTRRLDEFWPGAGSRGHLQGLAFLVDLPEHGLRIVISAESPEHSRISVSATEAAAGGGTGVLE